MGFLGMRCVQLALAAFSDARNQRKQTRRGIQALVNPGTVRLPVRPDVRRLLPPQMSCDLRGRVEYTVRRHAGAG